MLEYKFDETNGIKMNALCKNNFIKIGNYPKWFALAEKSIALKIFPKILWQLLMVTNVYGQ